MKSAWNIFSKMCLEPNVFCVQLSPCHAWFLYDPLGDTKFRSLTQYPKDYGPPPIFLLSPGGSDSRPFLGANTWHRDGESSESEGPRWSCRCLARDSRDCLKFLSDGIFRWIFCVCVCFFPRGFVFFLFLERVSGDVFLLNLRDILFCSASFWRRRMFRRIVGFSLLKNWGWRLRSIKKQDLTHNYEETACPTMIRPIYGLFNGENGD